MLRINRPEFLQRLELVQSGLSPRGIIDQSNCFVFSNGGIHTFNGEVACYHEQGLQDVTGAIQALPFLTQLQKWKEDEIEVDLEGDTLWVYGQRRKAYFNIEKEIHLPIDTVDRPKDWNDLPENFGEAVDLVQACAGKDQSKFQLTCVHIHPDWIEASDDVQISRYYLKTTFQEKTLVRQSAIKNIPSLGMKHFSNAKRWLHFKNPAGLTFSCLRYLEEFPEVGDALKVRGVSTVFPKSLNEAVEKAEVFTSEQEENQVRVELRKDKLRIKGTGSSGGYIEVKEATYDGDEIAFMISPKMLVEITRRHNEVFVAEERLFVDGKTFVYMTCTGKVEEKE